MEDIVVQFYSQSIALSEADLRCSIDLRPFMNPAPYVVYDVSFSLQTGLSLLTLGQGVR